MAYQGMYCDTYEEYRNNLEGVLNNAKEKALSSMDEMNRHLKDKDNELQVVRESFLSFQKEYRVLQKALELAVANCNSGAINVDELGTFTADGFIKLARENTTLCKDGD